MSDLIKEAGASFIRAFIASFLILVPGILAAPNVSSATAVAWGASASSLIAGFRAVQVFVPEFSIGYLITKVVGSANVALEAIEDSFARAFLGTFITLLFGVLAAPDFSTARSLGIAAVVGALTAGFRAIEGAFTVGESPNPKVGLKLTRYHAAKARLAAA